MSEFDQSINPNTEPSLLDGTLDFGEEDVVFFEEQSALTDSAPNTEPIAEANNDADTSMPVFAMRMDDATPMSEIMKIRSEFRKCMNMTFSECRSIFKMGECNLKAMPSIWNVGKYFRMSGLSAHLNFGMDQLLKKTKMFEMTESGFAKEIPKQGKKLDDEKKQFDENLKERSKNVKLEESSPSKGGMMASEKMMKKSNGNDSVKFDKRDSFCSRQKMNDNSWSKKERNSLNSMDDRKKKNEDLFKERSSKSKKSSFDDGFDSKKSKSKEMSMDSNKQKGAGNWNL